MPSWHTDVAKSSRGEGRGGGRGKGAPSGQMRSLSFASFLAMVEPRPSNEGSSSPALIFDRWPSFSAIVTPSRMSAPLHASRGPKHLHNRCCVHSFVSNWLKPTTNEYSFRPLNLAILGVWCRAAKDFYRHYSASSWWWSSLDPASFPLQDQGFCGEDFLATSLGIGLWLVDGVRELAEWMRYGLLSVRFSFGALLLLLALLCAEFLHFLILFRKSLNPAWTHLKSRKTIMSAWKLVNLLSSLMTQHSLEHRANQCIGEHERSSE